MRCVSIAVAAVLITACATQEPAKPVPPAEKFAVIDETNIVDAQKAGVKVVNDKGTKLVCRRDKATGTRLKEKTVCLTAEEWDSAHRTAREALDKPVMAISEKK